MPAVDFTILINTYNRPQLLVRVLRAVLAQRLPGQWSIEIIVVDDGSTQPTRAFLEREGLLERIVYLPLAHQGQGPARNAGLRQAQGRWIIFLGDDIVPEVDWLAAHARLLSGAADEKRMSLGYCAWQAKNISHSLYVYEQAHHYENLTEGQPADFRYFYTANLALPRQAIEEVGDFDASFAGYGWEDTDLGYRLEQAGWALIYNPSARAEHLHPPMTIRQMCARQIQIGKGGCRFYAKYPTPEVEQVAFWPGTRRMKPGPAWRRELGIAAAAVLERLAPRSELLGRIYGRLVVSCRCQGVKLGRKERV